MTNLSWTEQDYPAIPARATALAAFSIMISLAVGFLFTGLRLVGLADAPWLFATAGLWLPAVVIGVLAIVRHRRR